VSGEGGGPPLFGGKSEGMGSSGKIQKRGEKKAQKETASKKEDTFLTSGIWGRHEGCHCKGRKQEEKEPVGTQAEIRKATIVLFGRCPERIFRGKSKDKRKERGSACVVGN